METVEGREGGEGRGEERGDELFPHPHHSTYLKEVVIFDGTICLPVVVEPLEMHHQHRRQRLDAHSLQRVPLLPTCLTQVRIVPLQPIPLHKLLQRLLQPLGLDRKRQGQEGLLPIKGVVTPSADLLVQECTTKGFLENLRTGLFLLVERKCIIR